MGKGWAVLFAIVMLFCLGMFLLAPAWGLWLPEGVSTHSDAVDNLFYIILYVTGFFFILTEALLVRFMYQYAGKEWKKAPSQAQGISFFGRLMKPFAGLWRDQHRVELAWTLVPAVILLYIAFVQVETWATVKYQSRMPTLADKQSPLQIDVSARQFEWRMRYPSSVRFQDWLKNKDNADTARDYKSFALNPHQDDVRVVNELHVWVGHPVLVHLSTRDVIHSFNLPHHRIKQDALPGRIIPVWFTPTKGNTGIGKRKDQDGKEVSVYVDGIHPETGKQDNLYIWDLACAELCGWGHYRMIARIYVHKDQQEFLDWLKKAEAQQKLSTNR